MATLVLNAGSSSLKCALFDGETRIGRGSVEEIGHAPVLRFGREKVELAADTTHEQALGSMLERIDPLAQIDPNEPPNGRPRLRAVGHRIVHGGDVFEEPAIIDETAIMRLFALNKLAPLHNPVGLRIVQAAQKAAPSATHVACFDTAFHAVQPSVATRFALPRNQNTVGLRRYGFHGLSYEGIVTALSTLPAGIPRRLLACHLGAGASLCAIVNGASVATTMGYSPLDGLTMGTRSGTIDPAAVLELARRMGIDEAEDLLNRKSGLLGLSAESADMRVLSASAAPKAKEAREHFIYWAIRHAGSMIAAMGGMDAIAFTGGIGENDAKLRAEICEGLGWTGLRVDVRSAPDANGAFHSSISKLPAYVVPADEEGVIARAVSNYAV